MANDEDDGRQPPIDIPPQPPSEEPSTSANGIPTINQWNPQQHPAASSSSNDWSESLGIHPPDNDTLQTPPEDLFLDQPQCTNQLLEPRSIQPSQQTDNQPQCTNQLSEPRSYQPPSQRTDKQLLDEYQMIQRCAQLLDKPHNFLVESTSLTNNFVSIINQLASGTLTCEAKSVVKYLVQDLADRGILNRSYTLLFQNWKTLQGSEPVDVLLALYSQIVSQFLEQSAEAGVAPNSSHQFTEQQLKIEMMETANTALQDQVSSLQEELQQKTIDSSSSVSIEKTFRQQLEEIKKILDKQKIANQELKQNNRDQKKEISDLRIQQAAMVNRTEASEEQNKLQSSIDNMEAEKTKLEEEADTLKAKLNTVTADLQIFKTEADKARSEGKNFRSQFEAAERENDKKLSTITDLNVSVKNKEDEIQSLTKDNEELRADVSDKDNKIMSLKKKLAEKEKQISKEKPLQQQVQQLHKSEKDDLLAKLKTQQAEKKKALDSLEYNNSQIRAELEKTEKRLTALRKEHDACRATASAEAKSISNLELKLADSEATVEQLQETQLKADKENQSAKSKIKDLEEEVSSLKAKLKNAASDTVVTELQNTVAKIEQNRDEALTKMNVALEKVLQLTETNESMEQQLSEKTEEIFEMRQKLTDKERKLDTLNQQLRRQKLNDNVEDVKQDEATVAKTRKLSSARESISDRPRTVSDHSQRPSRCGSRTHSRTSVSSSGSRTRKGEPSKFQRTRKRPISPSSTSSQTEGDESYASPLSSRPSSPDRRVKENSKEFRSSEEFIFEADPVREFPEDIREVHESPSASLKRSYKGQENTASKFSRYSETSDTNSSKPRRVPEEDQTAPRPKQQPPLLKQDRFQHYDSMSKEQWSRVLQQLKAAKKKVLGRIASDQKLVNFLRGTHSDQEKQTIVDATLKSLAQCNTLRELHNWTTTSKSSNDFQPFPNLSEDSPEWQFISFSNDKQKMVRIGQTMAVFRAYSSKVYRFFEFVKKSPEANQEDRYYTYIHLNPKRTDFQGNLRDKIERKMELLIIFIILNLALYEDDNIKVFRTNPSGIVHYQNQPFTPEWVDEIIQIRSPNDPYLLPKDQFLDLYVKCTDCSRALDAWNIDETSSILDFF